MNIRSIGVCLAAVSLAACTAQDHGQPPAEVSKTARNVILFVGDGMGVSTVTAARIFDGQSKGLAGEENVLPFETFPNVALVKTYNTNQQVPDSAGTITAMMTGHKTRAGMINVGPESERESCEGQLRYPLAPIARRAAEHGKSVGVVTTARLTHATPSAVYASVSERDWESDRLLTAEQERRGCRDIAWQLLNRAEGVEVAMGGGRKHFYGTALGGERRDPEADLVSDWVRGDSRRRFVDRADQLGELQPAQQVLGLFAKSHMTYTARKGRDSVEPTLAEMATTAVRLLDDDEDGYFLLVEGGRIDHGHHDGKPGYALVEAQEFAKAVQAVMDLVDPDETLLLVTADHSHTFTIGGYPTRGNPILGLVVQNDSHGNPKTEPQLASDGQPYTSVAYANGPGAVTELPRPAPQTGVGALAQSLVPLEHRNDEGELENDETHGGEDVALYATGPGSSAAHGVIEQNLIYNIMVAAYGWQD